MTYNKLLRNHVFTVTHTTQIHLFSKTKHRTVVRKLSADSTL